MASVIVWAGWACCVLGVWILIAPWVLGYYLAPSVTWSSWIPGIVLIVLGGLTGFTARQKV